MRALRPADARHAVLFEDADRATQSEALFFHLMNMALQNDVWLLLTCRAAPDAWGLKTPRPVVATSIGAGRAASAPRISN